MFIWHHYQLMLHETHGYMADLMPFKAEICESDLKICSIKVSLNTVDDSDYLREVDLYFTKGRTNQPHSGLCSN